MGIPGAGKSRVAEEYVARGYLRLNRDERGGTLRELADALDEKLSAGARRVVLDNTYLTRASRSYVLEAAGRHGVAARCVWLDTPLAQAQVNLVERLLDRFGSLRRPGELRLAAKREPGLLAPTSQMRALRELEPPSADEGCASVEQVAFERAPSGRTRAGVFVAAPRCASPAGSRRSRRATRARRISSTTGAPTATRDALAAEPQHSSRARSPARSRPRSARTAAGPPDLLVPPAAPGLPLAFARAHGVDPARSLLVGSAPAHRTLATTLGARYVAL